MYKTILRKGSEKNSHLTSNEEWMLLKISVLIVARNEERLIANTVNALLNQTLKPNLIVVVNDGSIDNTGKIARKLGCHVIDLPYHKEKCIGKPELAMKYNTGLKYVKKLDNFDYILFIGADHAIPPDYIEKIVKRMESDPNIAVASGSIEGEVFDPDSPRGSGRIIRVKFWKDANRFCFPLIYGWESWIILKAQQLGYQTVCFEDIRTRVQRKTSNRKALYLGKAMRALGYDTRYALGRCLITFLRQPRAGIEMFSGWLGHENEKSDIAYWVNERQKSILWNKIKTVIKKGGRLS